jgi:hypothetical protein
MRLVKDKLRRKWFLEWKGTLRGQVCGMEAHRIIMRFRDLTIEIPAGRILGRALLNDIRFELG